MKTDWAAPDWKIVKMGDVVKRVRKPVSVDDTTLYREIGIRSHGKGIFHKEEVTGKSLGNKRVFWIEPGCFVVNIVFAWEGAVAQTSSAENGMIASHRFPMYRPKLCVLDLDFMTYFFKSARGIYSLGLASPGGAGRNKTLGQEEFLQLDFPLPSFAEQKEIVSILQTCDEAIVLTEQLIAAKQRRKQAFMQRLLTGKVRFPGFDGEWSRDKLQNITAIDYGKSPSEIRDDNGCFNIWGTGGLVGKTNIALCSSPAVIIGRKGTIDKPILTEEPFWTIDTTFYCLPKPTTNVRWLYYALSHIDLKQYNEASGVPSLSRSTLYNIHMQVPPMAEQCQIAELLLICDQEINLLQQKLAALRQQKQGLMQQLLTGKIRVKA